MTDTTNNTVWRMAAAGLFAVLAGCASTQSGEIAGPRFPPHLAHLSNHAFFVEQCDHAGQSSRKQQRCLRLHDDLQQRIAYFDERFRRNNQCVRRTREVNGELISDTRECRFVQEGAAARHLGGGY